jgi:mannosylglycoprotein endo-beta-mannosidase
LPTRSGDSIDILNIKLKRFINHLKEWGSNLFGHVRKKRNQFKEELACEERDKESAPLSPSEYIRKTEILVELHNIYADEEIYWLQKTTERWLLKEDHNSAYFHIVANGRRQKILFTC